MKWRLLVLGMAIGSVASAQNVGIGTATPVARLHIEVPSGLTIPIMQVNKVGSLTPYFIIDPNGKVGIGVASPSEAMDISGNIRFSGALMPAGNAGTSGQVLISQGPGSPPQWVNASSIGDNWGSQVAQTQSPIVGDGTAANPIALQSGVASGEVLIYNGTQWVIKQAPWDSVCNTSLNNMVQKWTGSNLCNSQIYDDGTNVGIGTTTPTQKLDVNGNIAFSGALMPGGNAGSAGQVLVSQGPGVPPQWQNISAIGGAKIKVSTWSVPSTWYPPPTWTMVDSIKIYLKAGQKVFIEFYRKGGTYDNSCPLYRLRINSSTIVFPFFTMSVTKPGGDAGLISRYIYSVPSTGVYVFKYEVKNSGSLCTAAPYNGYMLILTGY